MARKVYLQGGPKDGEYLTIHDNRKEVVFAERTPVSLTEPREEVTHSAYPEWRYRPQGRRTLQGIEVFECA